MHTCVSVSTRLWRLASHSHSLHLRLPRAVIACVDHCIWHLCCVGFRKWPKDALKYTPKLDVEEPTFNPSTSGVEEKDQEFKAILL